RRADGQREVRVLEILEPGDVPGVALGDGDLQHVLGEDRRGGRLQARVGDDLHLLLVGAGEDVGGRALRDLGGQRVAPGEVELHVQAGVVLLELLAQVGEDIGERGGPEDGDGAGQVPAGGGRRRGGGARRARGGIAGR